MAENLSPISEGHLFHRERNLTALRELESDGGHLLSPDTLDYCLALLSQKYADQASGTINANARIILKSTLFQRVVAVFGDCPLVLQTVPNQTDIANCIREVIEDQMGNEVEDVRSIWSNKRFVHVPIYHDGVYSQVVLDLGAREAIYLDCTMNFQLIGPLQVFVHGLADVFGCFDRVPVIPCLQECGMFPPEVEKDSCGVLDEVSQTKFLNSTGVRMCIFAERLFSIQSAIAERVNVMSDNPAVSRSLRNHLAKRTFMICDFRIEIKNLGALIKRNLSQPLISSMNGLMYATPRGEFEPMLIA